MAAECSSPLLPGRLAAPSAFAAADGRIPPPDPPSCSGPPAMEAWPPIYDPLAPRAPPPPPPRPPPPTAPLQPPDSPHANIPHPPPPPPPPPPRPPPPPP